MHRFLCKFESGGPSFKFCAQSSLLCIRVVSPSAGSRWSSTTNTPTAGGQALVLHPVQVVKHYYYTHCRWSSRRGRSSFWKSKQQVVVEWALQSGFCVLGIEARSKAGIQQTRKYCKCVYRKWVMQGISTKVGNARCVFKIRYCKWMQVVKQ